MQPSDATTVEVSLAAFNSNSFPQILAQLGVTIAVTTYQAGRLVLFRADTAAPTPKLNMHFRNYTSPMGLDWEPGRLALGTANEVREFSDIPSSAVHLNKAGDTMRHDAAFLPRNTQFTGSILIHEMAWVPQVNDEGKPAPSELVFVNTRFSCLATRSLTYSFAPVWKPPFISALAPEDRCHLNGLGLRDGQIRYVTALGTSDKPGGWRENKRAGGIVMDVSSNQVMTSGLSMPHSPRWHNGQLWVLESGNGGVGTINEQSGKYQEVCRLPGFTRGLDFVGPYAFIGLSQVRETAIFSGIAIAEKPENERNCGVWIVDTRTGGVAGSVAFTSQVEEVFAVKAMGRMRWPDVLPENADVLATSFKLSKEALQLVPKDFLATPPGAQGAPATQGA